MFGASVAFIVGGYRVYFWPQKSPLRHCRYGRIGIVDRLVPFDPRWVWVYSFLYYPFMVSPIFWINSAAEFFWICISYFLLLAIHVGISHIWPIKTPIEWRSYDKSKNSSARFLSFVQSIDKGGNCFPSMHVAVATLTGCYLTNFLSSGLYIYLFFVWICVFLISASTLFTKQHFFSDVVWGAIFGGSSYLLYGAFLTRDLFAAWVTLLG